MDAPIPDNFKKIKQTLPNHLFMKFLQKGEISYKGKKYVKKRVKKLD